jgi:hypothetical protein
MGSSMYFTQYVKQLPQYESKLVCLWGLPLTLLGTGSKDDSRTLLRTYARYAAKRGDSDV